MAQLKDIKERINSVSKTKKMTQAMKMVAAAKFKRFSKFALSSRVILSHIDQNVSQVMSEENGLSDLQLFAPVNADRQLVLIVSSDRGLCGGFNNNILKYSNKYLDELKISKDVILFGRKSVQFFKNKQINVLRAYENINDLCETSFISEFTAELISLYQSKKYSSIVLIYNEFKSAVSTNLISKQLLPVRWEKNEEVDIDQNILVESSTEQVLIKLANMYINYSINNAFLESFAAEQGARMAAMDSATDNAGDMIKELTLMYNRQRQAQITSELAEIVAGAEALSQ